MKTREANEIAKMLHESYARAESEKEVSAISQSIAKTLAKKGQIESSGKILEELERLIDKDNGIIEAKVTVKERLSETTLKHLRTMLKEKYNAKEIRIKEHVDERVIGGIKITVGEEVYDATLQRSLLKLQSKLQA